MLKATVQYHRNEVRITRGETTRTYSYTGKNHDRIDAITEGVYGFWVSSGFSGYSECYVYDDDNTDISKKGIKLSDAQQYALACLVKGTKPRDVTKATWESLARKGLIGLESNARFGLDKVITERGKLAYFHSQIPRFVKAQEDELSGERARREEMQANQRYFAQQKQAELNKRFLNACGLLVNVSFYNFGRTSATYNIGGRVINVSQNYRGEWEISGVEQVPVEDALQVADFYMNLPALIAELDLYVSEEEAKRNA